MSEREWQPGDVARFQGRTFDGIVFRYSPLNLDDDEWMSADQGGAYPRDDELRPLAVIDPEDREAVERLLEPLRRSRFGAGVCGDLSVMQAALREFADPPEPNRPPEPTGQGAVVVDTADRRWIRRILGRRSPWAYYDEVERSTTVRDWDEIDAVRVLSEGVQP